MLEAVLPAGFRASEPCSVTVEPLILSEPPALAPHLRKLGEQWLNPQPQRHLRGRSRCRLCRQTTAPPSGRARIRNDQAARPHKLDVFRTPRPCSQGIGVRRRFPFHSLSMPFCPHGPCQEKPIGFPAKVRAFAALEFGGQGKSTVAVLSAPTIAILVAEKSSDVAPGVSFAAQVTASVYCPGAR